MWACYQLSYGSKDDIVMKVIANIMLRVTESKYQSKGVTEAVGVANLGLRPSLGFMALRATMHSWLEGINPLTNPENGACACCS